MAFPKTLNMDDSEQVHRFIGGRTCYNRNRQFMRTARWRRLVRLWARNPTMKKVELARQLGVDRSTVTRDIQAILAESRKMVHCPICGQLYRADLFGLLEEDDSEV